MNTSHLFHKLIPYNGSLKNPIVLIHGFLESHTIWYDLPLDKLKRPILLVDVPGFGKSDLLDDKHPSIRYYAAEIYHLLESYNCETYQLVGHSLGGYIGLEMLKQSDKAEKLILLNSNFWSDAEMKQKDRTRVAAILLKSKNKFIAEAIPNLFLAPENHPKTVERLINEAKSGIGEWYAYASLAMRGRTDFTDFLKLNPARVEIIQGRNDALIPVETMLEKCASWKEIHVIEESGHMSIFEKPEEVIRLLNQLLD